MSRLYAPGDPVIYYKTKYSTAPGPRAREVTPSPHGEDYSYVVDKYWLVKECLDGGLVRLITRRGKEHVVREDSPNLRQAKWWERFVYNSRFPQLDQSGTQSPHLSAG
ncbi:MAG: hypothetical protein KDA84_22970 [Planctomycetaceae bacterium]|nr:hypothetical protein [Planctomycetaceae bacterium]